MPIDHVVRTLGLGFDGRRLGRDDGVAVGGMDFGFQADLLAMRREPLGAGEEIRRVLGLGGDAGETEILAELGEEPLLVLLQVIQDSLHGMRLKNFESLHNWIEASCCMLAKIGSGFLNNDGRLLLGKIP